MGRVFVWLQYIIPQHGISRIVLLATRVRARWFKNALIRGFLRLYSIDMTQAQIEDPYGYPTFNEFFTRALKPALRPIAASVNAVASPVDGTISENGCIESGQLLQAKGRRYALADLLASQPWSNLFTGGTFCTIYLAPFNYHRIHMPLAGTLCSTVYVPGRLFSVNSTTARSVPRLFARNERVLALFETPFGKMAMVLVGALNVGSMTTVWAGDITPAPRRIATVLPPSAVSLEKGAEMGRFNMGSTVILLFEAGRVNFAASLRAGSVVRLGQPIAQIQRGV